MDKRQPLLGQEDSVLLLKEYKSARGLYTPMHNQQNLTGPPSGRAVGEKRVTQTSIVFFDRLFIISLAHGVLLGFSIGTCPIPCCLQSNTGYMVLTGGYIEN